MRLPIVVVPLGEGFEELEAVAMIDVMRRGGIDVVVATLDSLEVIGANGITIIAECHISSISSDDITMIALPGGWDGTYRLAEDEQVQRLLQEMDAKGKDIGAICAAPFALDKAGVLKAGYTCYPGTNNDIEQTGYSDTSKVVQTENIMTSQGPGTAICFALAIIERLVSSEKALSVNQGILATYC